MKWLLAPTGASQFLTQLAALRVAGVNADQLSVVSMCQRLNASTEQVLREICDSFQCGFLGNLPTAAVDASTGRTPWSARLSRLISPDSYHRKRLTAAGWPRPDDVDGLVCSIRPWHHDELWLHFATEPRELICTIDGVSAGSPTRRLDGRRWRMVNAPFRDLPMDFPIYCPEYLLGEAKQLGRPCIIEEEVEEEIFARYRQTPLARQFWGQLQPFVSSNQSVAVVFSQDLSQAGQMNGDQEVQYYVDIVHKLKELGFNSVVIKQHPRDSLAKLQVVRDRLRDSPGVLVIEDQFSGVPVEPFMAALQDQTVVGIAANSSTLLSFRALTGADTFSIDSRHFPRQFCVDRDAFCRQHGVEVIAA